jgi:hypothetical protein
VNSRSGSPPSNLADLRVAQAPSRSLSGCGETGLTVTAIATGHQHPCGLLRSGAAWCLGNNGNGQVENGDTNGARQLSPVAVVGGGHTLLQ